jgi:hypothetical protein
VSTARRTVLVALALLAGAACEDPGGAPPLKLERTIPLPGVEGRIDHLDLDPSGALLAVAALGNGSVEVVDLAKGRVAHRLRGLEEPQGVVFLPDGRLAVTCGGDGSVRFHAAGTFAPAGRVDLGSDADNVRLESSTGRVWVGHGRGGLAALARGHEVADLKLAGHPESFQLEAKGTRVFVNVPGARHVAVLDRKAGRTLATWRLKAAGSNFPMALDEAHGRLFVGCRSPARLLVLDTADGRVRASVKVTADVDDIWLDDKGRRAFLSCGGGALDVLEATKGDAWRRVARVPTASGARTSLWDPARRRLYLAVPHRGSQRAEIRVYVPAH